MLSSSNARRLQGRPISSTAPTDGQGLAWSAASGLWLPTTFSGTGDVLHTRQILSGTGLTGGGDLSADRTLSIAAGGVGTTQLAAAAVTGAKLDPTIIQYATVSLTSAQIKTLSSVPVQLVAAQGAGTLIEPISYIAELTFVTTAYAGSSDFIEAVVGTSNVVTQGITSLIKSTSSKIGVDTVTPAALAGISSVTDVLNKALFLANPINDYTLGDGTLIVKVAYRVHSGL